LYFRRESIGEKEEGEVFITPPFNLKAKAIIHAVSPRYIDGNSGEEEKLRSCYRESLALARLYGFKSIAFPLLSTGSNGYPKDEAIRIATDECNAFLLEHEMDISLVVFTGSAVALGRKIFPGLSSYIDSHYVEMAKEREGMNRPLETYSRYADRNVEFSVPAPMAAPAPVEPLKQASVKKKKTPFESIWKRDKARAVEEEECWNLHDMDECEYELEMDDYFGALDERMSHMSDTFSEYLLYTIEQKGMTNAEVYKRGIVDKKVFSKIKNDPGYHPQKMTAMCLCVGAKLNLDEARDLLARAGYALSPCDKTDIIFSYFIENGIYDMYELDIQLEEYGEKCLIS